MKPFTSNESGDLAAIAISVTIFLVIVGYILAPVGLTAVAGVNTTAAGVATGTNANVWNALVPLTLAALIIGVVYNLKTSAKWIVDDMEKETETIYAVLENKGEIYYAVLIPAHAIHDLTTKLEKANVR